MTRVDSKGANRVKIDLPEKSARPRFARNTALRLKMATCAVDNDCAEFS
jgi:hypothetical protein